MNHPTTIYGEQVIEVRFRRVTYIHLYGFYVIDPFIIAHDHEPPYDHIWRASNRSTIFVVSHIYTCMDFT